MSEVNMELITLGINVVLLPAIGYIGKQMNKIKKMDEKIDRIDKDVNHTRKSLDKHAKRELKRELKKTYVYIKSKDDHELAAWELIDANELVDDCIYHKINGETEVMQKYIKLRYDNFVKGEGK